MRNILDTSQDLLDFFCQQVYTWCIHSLTVTIPKNLGMTEGQEMVVYKGIDGVIVLAPKLKDPFDGITDLRMTNDFEGVRSLDSEI